MRNAKIFLITTLFLVTALQPAFAEEEYVRLSLSEVTNGKAILTIDLDEGWHTYYKEPGDSGLPPRFDWKESVNAEEISIGEWPEPLTINEHGLTVYGYKDSVAFPVVFQTPDPDAGGTLSVKAEVLICNEICIPEFLEASAAFQP